jgi:phosphatidylinositol 3,5-bisphosphate 5-phosphatase
MASQEELSNPGVTHQNESEPFDDVSDSSSLSDSIDDSSLEGRMSPSQNVYPDIDSKYSSVSDIASPPPSPRTQSKPRDTREHNKTSQEQPQVLHRFTLYETATRFYLVGQDIAEKSYKVLKIDRTSPPGLLSIFEDDNVYDKRSKDELLTTIDEGNKTSGGLRMKCSAWGILGFMRFTEAYYMVLITKRSHAAVIGGHYISQIEATEVIPLTTGSTSRFRRDRNPEETRYLGIFSNIELAKSFYYSHTYNITRTLQHNICRYRSAWKQGISRPVPDLNDMFIWNHHLLDPANTNLKTPYSWCVPIIHGFIEQECLYSLCFESN